MTKIFKIPFATQGDRTAVPDDVQADGSLSYTQGYGYDYERDQATDPAAKDIEREKMNSIFHDITGAVGEIQAFGMPVWAEEGKPYAIRSVVYHNKKAWQSKIENNNTEPAAGVAWTELKADVTAEDVGAYTKVEANLKFQPVGNYADKNEVNGKLAKDQNGADIQDKAAFISNLGLGEAAKSGILQTTGTSKTDVMSQDAVTKLADKKFDKTGGVLTGNDNVITIRNSGANRANFIQGENSQENAEWMVGRLGLGSDVSLYSSVHDRYIAIRSDGIYTNAGKIMAGVSSLLDDRGYIKLGDSGLILQWGMTPNPVGGESVDIQFPIPFPTKCFAGVASPTSSVNNTGYNSVYFHIANRNSFRITNDRSGTANKLYVYWFAVGY
ncbi:gp53-like domain-containing protein [Morganella morganii]